MPLDIYKIRRLWLQSASFSFCKHIFSGYLKGGMHYLNVFAVCNILPKEQTEHSRGRRLRIIC